MSGQHLPARIKRSITPTDHRGRRVNIITTRRLAMPTPETPFARAAAKRVSITNTLSTAAFLGLSGVLAIVWLLIAAIGANLANSGGGEIVERVLSVCLVVHAIMSLFVMAALSVYLWRKCQAARMALTATLGYCPACQYPIADQPKAGDGCAVCPECGGAWRVRGGDA